MPLTDWQFYLVTLLALGGLWLIGASLRRGRAGAGRCRHCTAGEAPGRQPHAVPLTIEGGGHHRQP